MPKRTAYAQLSAINLFDRRAPTRRDQGGNVQDRTAAEVVRLMKDEGVEIVDIRFCDLPGLMQHFSVPAHELTEDVLRGGLRLRRLVDPGLPGDPGVGHAPAPRPRHRRHRPLPPAQDAEPQLLRPRPGHARELLARPPLRGPQGRALPGDDRASPTPSTSAPRPSSSSSTTSGSPRTSTRPSTRSTRSRASGTPAATRSRTSASSPATRRGTSRSRRWTTSRTCARR